MIKKLFIVLCLLLSSLPAYAQDWFTAGVLTNPVANAILAETTPFNGPTTICIQNMIISSNVAAVLIFEQRNATNTANINSQAILVGANQTLFYPQICLALTENQQRFRLRLNAAVTGTMQASIFP